MKIFRGASGHDLGTRFFWPVPDPEGIDFFLLQSQQKFPHLTIRAGDEEKLS